MRQVRTRIAAIGVVAIVLLTACPPPPPPPPLPGSFSHVAAQRLLVAIISPQGVVVECKFFLDVRYDLAYTYVLVSTKTRPEGPCLSTEWKNRRAVGRCDRGTSVAICGGSPGEADWSFATEGVWNQKRAYFNISADTAVLRMTFAATLTPPSGLIGPFPVSVTGQTPQIRCRNDSVERACKFQSS